jgi:hypothetical protein
MEQRKQHHQEHHQELGAFLAANGVVVAQTTQDWDLAQLLRSARVTSLEAEAWPAQCRQTDRHANAVDDIVRAAVAEKKSGKQNVLAAGVWVNSGNELQTMRPNAALDTIRLPVWERLHAQVGTPVFRHLLLRTQVWTQQQQVSGPPPRSPVSDSVVERWRIFYNDAFKQNAGYEKGHILHGFLVATDRFVNRLCRVIFACPSGQRLHPRYRKLRDALRARMHPVPFGVLLRSLCPDDGPCDHGQVAAFVWACVVRQFPRRVWGGRANRHVGRALIDAFVRARRRETIAVEPWAARFVCAREAPLATSLMVRQWLAWLLSALVIPLVRNHFYVTETADGYQRVTYYRKPYWRRVMATPAAVTAHLALEPISVTMTAAVTAVSRLRVIPKPNNAGMRVIARVQNTDMLRAVLHVLRMELRSMGSTVFGFDDIFQRLVAFRNSCSGGPFFLVKMDVKAAFDQIDQHVLCRLVSGVFRQEHYRIGRRFVDRSALYDALMQHIRLNIVQFRGRLYRQERGVSQGSVLSSLLCSLYYAHRLDHAIPPTASTSLVMRFVDDMLCICRDRDTALAFVTRMRETGVVFSEHKTRCSTDDDDTFAWCGLLFDTRTLNVSWDYGRYAHISDTLTAPPLITLATLRSKMRQYARVKCLRVLVSLDLNTYDTVLLNVYQTFLFLALKCHCLVASGNDFIPLIVQDLAHYVTDAVRRVVHPLSVLYLCVHAFSRRCWFRCHPWLLQWLAQAPPTLQGFIEHIVDPARSATVLALVP